MHLATVARRHWASEQRPAAGWASPTDIERATARLVAEGLTNQRIADQLFISTHTVAFHLALVLQRIDGHDVLRAGVAGALDRVDADATDAVDRDHVAGATFAVLTVEPHPVGTPPPTSAAMPRLTASQSCGPTLRRPG